MRTAISPRLATRTFEMRGTAHRNAGGLRRSRPRPVVPRRSPIRPTGSPWCWRVPQRTGGAGRAALRALVRPRQSRAGPGSGREAGPEGVDRDAAGREEVAQQRQAEADDAVVVALDARDERAAEPVDRERTGDPEGLARGDVGVDLGVRDV